jgi:hypothetical protein
MLDISAVKAKARAAEREFDNASYGPAGVTSTRREPPMLIDRQRRMLDQFAALVPKSRRSAYHSAVLARLSGSPGDAAVHTACVNAALEGYLSIEALAEADLISVNARGFVRPQHNERRCGSRERSGVGR